MSTPETTATPDNTEKAEDVKQPVEAQVSNLVKEITTDEEGNYVFPEGIEISPELKFAATAEKRRRDTQASFTQNQQATKALEAENAKLLEQLQNSNMITFTPEELEELETLKHDDPVEWRKRLNNLEETKMKEAKDNIATLTGEAKKAAEIQFELDRRAQVLNEFNETLEKPITDEVLASEIPPRITKKLENGEVTFEAFLEEVAEYLKTPKVIANPETLNQPNLGKSVGGNSPSDYKAEESVTESYGKTVF